MSIRRRADAERNRAVLLAAAREHQQRCGELPGLTDLASLAGVGVGTAYRNFPTQGALVAAMAASGLDELVATARAAADLDDARALPAFVEAGVRLLLADRQLADVVAAATAGEAASGPAPVGTAAHDHTAAAAVAELLHLLADLLARAQRAGAVRGDLGPADVARLACGVQHAVRLHTGSATSGPGPGHDPGVVQRYVQVLLAGLRA
ncbi:SbtR family transcriptional regulator [Quadrisphaera sp. KR29]|uniref:SbtR family transcriptional regulator n=1 Tax=Quadrisphaera sp. KR29 TaxID=3461391 RepID=UPI004044EC0D